MPAVWPREDGQLWRGRHGRFAAAVLISGVATLCLAVCAAPAQETAAAPERIPLNSERIAAQFGTYGIDILAAEGELRVSSLFSGVGPTRVTRTLAVVQLPASVPSVLAAQHAAILSGGSIGATFQDAGWTVDKRNLYFGEIPVTGAIARLMRLDAAAGSLAVHVYDFAVRRGPEQLDYAVIAEIHHPDYLDSGALRQIYGSVAGPEAAASARLAELLAQVATILQ